MKFDARAGGDAVLQQYPGFLRWVGRRIDGASAFMMVIAMGTVVLTVALVGIVVWLSFTEGTPGDPDLQYTLANYANVLTEAGTYRVLWNTVFFALVTLLTSFAIGLPIAWIVERTDIPGKSTIFSLMTTSLLIPGFAVALGWVFLLHPRVGIVNLSLMNIFGLNQAPFNIASIGGMGFAEGLTFVPLIFIMTTGVLRSMNASLEEAAAMSGAKPWQILFRVTIPVLWPGILASIIYTTAICFAAFDIPAIIGLGNRIYTFSTFIFDKLNPPGGLPEYGAVATLSVGMILLATPLGVIYDRVQKQAPRYAVISGKAAQPRDIRIRGGARRWAWTLIAGYFLVGQVLPLLTLAWISTLPFPQSPSLAALQQVSLNNFANIPGALLRKTVGNTFLLMVIVPTLTLIVSMAISWVVLRTRYKGRGLLDFVAFLPLVVPTIVFSVAALLLSLFVLRHFLPIYGTIWILVLVYVVVRVSYGTRVTGSALIQVHRELEEAARVSGARTAGILRWIVLPILRPPLLAAWIWIALLSYRELTLPVILSSRDNIPFSVLVWSYAQSSSFGLAAAAALLMLLIIAPMLGLYWFLARPGRVQKAAIPA